MAKFRLTIHHDEDSSYLGDDFHGGDSLFKVHSFNNRHVHFTHPDEVFACVNCGSQADEFWHTNVEQVNVGDMLWADWAAEYRAEAGEELLHDYEGPKGFILSYFEHGLCRWGLGGTMDGMADFRWDGVGVAGFLEVRDDNAWFTDKPIEEQEEIVKSHLEAYTDWCNGNVYGYVLEQIEGETCNLGHFHEADDLEIDSCWGFIGEDHLADELRGVLRHYGATEENTVVIDKAYGMADYLNLWKEKANA